MGETRLPQWEGQSTSNHRGQVQWTTICWKGLGLEKISAYIHNKSVSVNVEDTFESSKSSHKPQNRHFMH